jgi:2-dehydropantoate 2-reductase
LSDLEGAAIAVSPERIRFSTDASALAACHLVLVTVKGGDTAAAGAALKSVLPDTAVVVSFQNGVGNPAILRAAGLRVFAGMVPWNVLRSDGGRFHQGTSGVLAVEEGAPAAFLEAVRAGGLRIRARRDVVALQWGKLLVNLNNSVNALAGVPIAEMLRDRRYRLIMAAIAREAIATLAAARVPARLSPPLPLPLVPALLSAPDWLFRAAARPMVRVDPHARSSMWDDLQRGRKTEIEQLNGEIVRLAEKHGGDAPLSRAIVELVHAAEGHGSPALDAAALRQRLGLR